MYSSRNRGGFNSNRGRSRFRRPSSGSSNSHAKYIKKAVPPKESEPYVATFSYTALEINRQLKDNILRKGYTQPTPIQDQTIQPIMQGHDVVGIANTGTGKTAAFLIPMLDKMSRVQNEQAIIIVPTRELAIQIQQEMRTLAQGMNIYSTLCVGGMPIGRQISEIRRNPQIIIGTPGRLKDLMNRRVLDIGFFTTFVLDEVDRMLDMGFLPDIRFIINHLPQKRQSLFFSATLSPSIRSLIQTFTQNPVMVSVKTQETTHNVEQDIVKVSFGEDKIAKLEELLRKEGFNKVLIFGRTKRGVERLSTNLFRKGFKVSSIHGDKSQFQRNQAIRLFKEDKISILVATDVASRGIDIADITHVINYDLPATDDDYTHRVGRTGRADKMGVALTFVE